MGTGSGGPMADINVTPLVDVMLVLLIIFMVTAPLDRARASRPTLPKTKAPNIDSAQPKLVLSITKERHVYLGETEIAYAELKDKLTTNERLKREKVTVPARGSFCFHMASSWTSKRRSSKTPARRKPRDGD